MRPELETRLRKIAARYRRLPNPGARIAYLENEIRKHEQQLKEDWSAFRRLINEGTLEGDPVEVHNDLDEDALAIGRMKVWLEAEKAPAVTGTDDPVEFDQQETTAESPVADRASIQSSTKEYLSVKELSDYLSVPEDTVRDWRKKGTIPFTKVGRHLRFSKKEIDRWLRKRSEKEI